MRIRHLILLALVLAVAGGTGASTASASGAQTITVVARQVDVNPGETIPVTATSEQSPTTSRTFSM